MKLATIKECIKGRKGQYIKIQWRSYPKLKAAFKEHQVFKITTATIKTESEETRQFALITRGFPTIQRQTASLQRFALIPLLVSVRIAPSL